MTRRIGIHESVGELFPTEQLETAFAEFEMESENEVTTDVVESDVDELSDVDVCVTLVHDPAFLESGLEWVHSVQAGVDRFPLEAFRQQGIALTNSEGIHGDVVGETVLGYLLTFARGLHRYRDSQGESQWIEPDWSGLRTLGGERICVIGLGTLGQGVVRRAEAFDMEVVGVRRTPTPVDGVKRVYPPADLEAAIDGAMFVVLCVPLTDATRGMIGSEELAAMDEEGYLVNVARGAVIEEKALIDALETGTISGAALDVFETEPLTKGSPLWRIEEVLVTPHIAAAHEDYAERVATIICESLRRCERGEGLANRVV